MEDFIGRPYDDTVGTITDVAVRYEPCFHNTIEETIKAMPHVHFTLFEGTGLDEIDGLIEKKGNALSEYQNKANKHYPKMAEKIRRFMMMVDLNMGGKEIISLHDETVRLMFQAEIKKQETGNENFEYRTIRALTDFVGLLIYQHNLMYTGTSDESGRPRVSSRQLEEGYGENVDVVKKEGIIGSYARDPIIALLNGDRKVMATFPRRIIPNIMGFIDESEILLGENGFWEERGYEVSKKKLHGLEGGEIVANRGHIFIGMNSFGEIRYRNRFSNSESKYRKMMEMIEGDAEAVFYRDDKLEEHIDVFLMPVSEDCVFLSDPTGTVDLLERSRIHLDSRTINNMGVYAKQLEKYREDLEKRGFTVRPAPFLIVRDSDRDYVETMFAYPNSLQESGVIYAPKRGEVSEVEEFRVIGEILDEEFYNEASKYKKVVPIPGFEVPFAWKTAGLRCMANVIGREY